MVYRFVLLSDEDDSFSREFEFLESNTLLDFHNSIQEELEFDKSQMASFFLASNKWEKEEEFTLLDMGIGSATMEETLLEDIIINKNQKLLYLFDMFNNRALYIEFTGEDDIVEGREYPVCTNSRGAPPKQITFGKGRVGGGTRSVISDDEDDDDSGIYFDTDNEDMSGFSNIDNIDDYD